MQDAYYHGITCPKGYPSPGQGVPQYWPGVPQSWIGQSWLGRNLGPVTGVPPARDPEPITGVAPPPPHGILQIQTVTSDLPLWHCWLSSRGIESDILRKCSSTIWGPVHKLTPTILLSLRSTRKKAEIPWILRLRVHSRHIQQRWHLT